MVGSGADVLLNAVGDVLGTAVGHQRVASRSSSASGFSYPSSRSSSRRFGRAAAAGAAPPGRLADFFGQPADHDSAGVPDQVHGFGTGGDLLEAGVGQHRADAGQQFLALMIHAATLERRPWAFCACRRGEGPAAAFRCG